MDSRWTTRLAGCRAYRRRVQLVLQDPTGALNPRRTVYEAVAEGLRIHRVPGDERAQVAEALSLAGLRPAEPGSSAATRTSCPAASASASSSPARWCWSPR